MSLRSIIKSRFESRPDPLARFRDLPNKLLSNFDILMHGQGLLGTMQTGLPQDREGHPIPWFTYPAIEYLGQLDLRGKKIFEYGCGNSTLYWLRRGAQVWAVDHDQEWFERMRTKLPDGMPVCFADNPADYAGAIARAQTQFDIVVIDGAFRETCVDPAIAHLRPGGFIIFDNAERDRETGRALRDKGLLEIDFSGFGPINDYTWTTAILLTKHGITGFDYTPPSPVGGNPSR